MTLFCSFCNSQIIKLSLSNHQNNVVLINDGIWEPIPSEHIRFSILIRTENKIKLDIVDILQVPTLKSIGTYVDYQNVDSK